MIVKNGTRSLNTVAIEKCMSINNEIKRICTIRKLAITIAGDSSKSMAAPNIALPLQPDIHCGLPISVLKTNQIKGSNQNENLKQVLIKSAISVFLYFLSNFDMINPIGISKKNVKKRKIVIENNSKGIRMIFLYWC